MSITTAPGATDVCICGHAGATHDATSQVCRFQNDVTSPCGCVSFGYPGGITSHSPIAGNTPALTGPSPTGVVPPVGNRNR